MAREDLRANSYNPNRVAPPEMRLLKISILEDGWTQPIVATTDGEIVDGFHRWTVSGDPEVAVLTGGLVPVVYLTETPPDQQRMATIRHNRARGNHYVVRMASIVRDLVEEGLGIEEIAARLQMETEEVERLLDRGKMTKRRAADRLGQAWRPEAKEGSDDH